MKLITELNDTVNYVTEAKEDGKKNLYIEGVFLQAEVKNRNGRVYPKAVLEREVNRYNEQFVSKGRAFGELGHPDGPQINLDRVSHIIETLKCDGSNWVGRAKITDTPMGNIARGLIESGAQLGVSTRGMGSLKLNREGVNEVQDDFHLATAADIVADPSAPDAFVNGIMEGVEYFWENNLIVARDAMNQVEQAVRSHEFDTKKFEIFENFINKISKTKV
tara:strand:- start:1422 stop:2081 length:660 start_codon:yes stop_codon:yes gene_type:complete